MDLRRVDGNFAVAPQLLPDDMQALAQLGYVAVVCNRPDGEDDGQPPAAVMREAAQAAGLAFHHLPVSGGVFPDAAVAAFRAVRRGTEGPVLAYCRSGTRCITLDTLANPQALDAVTRLNRAEAAGYDLSALRDQLSC